MLYSRMQNNKTIQLRQCLSFLLNGGISPSYGTIIGLGDCSLGSAREKNLKGSICFYYQTSVGKRILKIMVKVDTSSSLASSKKRQNVT